VILLPFASTAQRGGVPYGEEETKENYNKKSEEKTSKKKASLVWREKESAGGKHRPS